MFHISIDCFVAALKANMVVLSHFVKLSSFIEVMTRNTAMKYDHNIWASYSERDVHCRECGLLF